MEICFWKGPAPHKPHETPQLKPFLLKQHIRLLCELNSGDASDPESLTFSSRQEKHNKLSRMSLKHPGILNSRVFPQPAAAPPLLQLTALRAGTQVNYGGRADFEAFLRSSRKQCNLQLSVINYQSKNAVTHKQSSLMGACAFLQKVMLRASSR